MKNRWIIIFVLSSLGAQVSYTVSNELKYGDGMTQSNIGGPESYGYFENLLDINMYYKSISLFTQMEYSDPPQFGLTKRKLNKGFLEHQGDNLRLVIGDIYTLYGRGLGINMFQDQSLDFDNSVRGVEFDYSDDERGFRLYGLSGRGDYWYKSAGNATGRLNDLSMENSVYAFGFEFTLPVFPGEWQFLNINQNSIFPEDDNQNDQSHIIDMNDYSYSGSFNLFDLYVEQKDMKWADELNPIYDSEGVEEISTGSMKYASVNTNIAGFGLTLEYKDYFLPNYQYSISNPPTVFMESSSPLIGRNLHIINFNDEKGYQLEVVNKVNSNLDVVFNTSLSYRNSGEFEKSYITHYLDDTNDYSNPEWLVSNIETDTLEYPEPSINDILSFGDDFGLFAYWPYRQFYTGVYGYALDNKLFYKLGFDVKNEIINYHVTSLNFIDTDFNAIADEFWWDKWNENFYDGDSNLATIVFEAVYSNTVEGKIQESIQNSDLLVNSDSLVIANYDYENQRAVTIPTQFSYSFGDGSSITTYIELQTINNKYNRDEELVGYTNKSFSLIEKIQNNYISFSYRSKNRWTITLLYDREEKYQNEVIFSDNDWVAVDFTIDVNDQNQFSLFYGSERGGLRCANGVCAYQPAFEDGFKVSLKTIF